MKTLANYILHRNYGCRIKEFLCDGIQAVSLENDVIKVVVLPGKGTDIVEFVYKPLDIDFLWHSFNGLRNPDHYTGSTESPGAPFLDLYEGGWQELFPNIGDSCVYKGAHLGTHGEVCNQKWTYEIKTDSLEAVSVKFSVYTVRTPFHLEKTLTMKLHDPCLYIDERVQNVGNTALQFMWGHHPAFGPVFIDDSCRIILQETPEIAAESVVGGDIDPDVKSLWPILHNRKGEKIDISVVQKPESNISFSGALRGIHVGEYRIINKNLELGFGMRWDPTMFPCMWIWAPNGSGKEWPWFGRDYVVAVEPWSAIPSNLETVANENRGINIAPGEVMQTKIEAFAFST